MDGVDVLDLARWQFGITTVYHFLMVPLTIGLSLLVAGMQTAWVRTGERRYLAMTKFWGKLLLINFAMGVVTGIVQEFQFGMAWSEYSRFVGDVFGAPLAMEGLVAFFVESTFLGLWIFGWDRLPRRVHLACVWAFSLATIASAYFILAANSWMQHPVGVELVDGRPRLTSIWAVLGNSTVLAAFPHAIAGAFAVAGAFLVGIAAWHLWRSTSDIARVARRRCGWARWVGVVAFAALVVSGDQQSKLMFEQQPMKMASAEALCHTEKPAGFSVFAIGDVSDAGLRERQVDHRAGAAVVPGQQRLRLGGARRRPTWSSEYQARYGEFYPVDPRLGELSGQPIDYVPNLPVTYWGFRLMIGFGAVAALVGVCRAVADPPRPGAADRGGSRGSRWPASRRRSWPTASAGSSPRWAASRSSSHPTRPVWTVCGCSPRGRCPA